MVIVMMIDTHCHLNKKYYDDVSKVIKNMENNIMIVSTGEIDDLEEVISLTEHENIYATIGIHPEFADDYNDDNLNQIEKFLSHPKVVGLGEVGLDYHYTKENKDKQKELFIKQIELANKYHKTLVIHTRDAIENTYNILKKYKKEDINVVLHCYSGSVEMAERFIKINASFGIGGVLTFKNEKKLKKVVKEVDSKYLLLETDSPFLTPEPFRGKGNEPKNVMYVASKISEIKNQKLEKTFEITTKNAVRVFGINLT